MIGNQNSRRHNLSRELLVQLYEVERLSIVEIERRTGCRTIHRELVRYSIPRRERNALRTEPITDPSATDLAYAAGFFDGEGSINIRGPGSSAKNNACVLLIKVAQIHDSPLIWLQERWGGSINALKKSRPTWDWTISSRQAGVFLQAILPYLIVKKEEALIAIEFQSHKRNTGRRCDPARFARELESKRLLESLRRSPT